MSKYKCYAPWASLDISPQGDITPCCKFRTQGYNERYNITKNTIQEYTDSDFLKGIKHEFLSGSFPQGCIRCVQDEQIGTPSKRQLDYERWTEQYDNWQEEDGYITTSIAFGNTCNLKCVMCGPYSSSRWRQEQKDLYNVDIKSLEYLNDSIVDQLHASMPNVLHIDIPGGEPFLSEPLKQLDFLSRLRERASNVTLHYTTNTQVMPDERWLAEWSNFKEIDVQLSIDGVESHYEYIRYPGNWNVLLNNVDQWLKYQQEYANIRLSVSHTVGAYNIYYMQEFWDWCIQTGLPKPYLGKVFAPEHFKPDIWSGKARQFIVDKLASSNHLEIQTWQHLFNNIQEPGLFEDFKAWIHRHDRYRKTSFTETFKELAPYVSV
jgi:MoaA/NifB/PqqE/SkfB family radical SAM enzyme